MEYHIHRPLKDSIILKQHDKRLAALRWFVAGLGSGWLPKAPGTWGSLAALPVAYAIVSCCGATTLLASALILWALGCWACVPVLRNMTNQDPGWIVVDEWVGEWLCLWVLLLVFAPAWWLWILGFAAFRLFDIWKPFPIRQLEHWGPSWWSIMFDDVVAGLMGAGLLLLLWELYRVV